MDFYITVSPEMYEKVKNLDNSLGMWFWNMAVMIAPEDTGNLRSAITLNSNTSKKINIRYNTMKANYIKFLEEGVGPVKKYKGFIGIDTVNAITEQLIIYLTTGKKPLFTRTPFVTLKSTKNVFPKERAFLRQANMNVSNIDAKSRAKISQIRESAYRKSVGLKSSNISGRRVETNRIRANSGIGELNKIYKRMKG